MDDNKDLQNEFDLPQDAAQDPILPDAPDITASFTQNTLVDLTPVLQLTQGIHHELSKVIIGQKDIIDLLMVAILSDGHVLLEGVPGIAKTLTAKLLAKAMDMKFSRIQFTPDLMPTDVVGTNVFNMKTAEFNFRPGPIFGNIILVDEINRAPAKTQAAMFEVMEEKQVTVDGVTYKMELPFFVMATQNPIEQEGTYKLPEAQLDRFLFKLIMKYPSQTEEQHILRRFHNNYFSDPSTSIEKVCTKEDLEKSKQLVEQILIQDNLLDYIAEIVHNTRTNGDLFLGASPRASLGILRASKAYAAINGRDFVTPDDIQAVAYPVLNHRIILNPDREMEGYETKDVIDSILHQIEVPR
ncbi:MAG TPA: MoxR family ATPase [Saprospiraceae bacterium]|nr:MoxR family ATPase [Saprospiraceae bacterium]